MLGGETNESQKIMFRCHFDFGVKCSLSQLHIYVYICDGLCVVTIYHH